MKYIILVFAALIAQQASGCIAIGTSCSKSGEACCASTDAAKPIAYCYGEGSNIFTRSYTCTECNSGSCYDEISEPVWYSMIGMSALLSGTSLIFVVGMVLEFMKRLGVIPKPKIERYPIEEESSELLALVAF